MDCPGLFPFVQWQIYIIHKCHDNSGATQGQYALRGLSGFDIYAWLIVNAGNQHDTAMQNQADIRPRH
jgi:hypothetical protein